MASVDNDFPTHLQTARTNGLGPEGHGEILAYIIVTCSLVPQAVEILVGDYLSSDHLPFLAVL